MRLRSVHFISAACLTLVAGCSSPPAPATTPTVKAPQLDAVATPTTPPRTTTSPQDEGEDARYRESRFHRAHDAFKAADDPACMEVAKVDFLDDDDEVFGLEVNGKARAYAVRALSYHHVINDQLAGQPLLVAY